METIIRTPSTQTITKVIEPPKDPKISTNTNTQVPYTEYEIDNAQPFEVDYYNLGDTWRDGFSEEIKNINSFFKYLIEKGKIDNTLEAVKIKLKEYNDIAGIKESDRVVMKIGKVNAYINFLKETEDLEKYGAKYGL